MKSNRRSGFTIVELLVVVAILLILSYLAFAVFGTGKSSDKMRSGARSAQSAILGAKDRALHAKEPRGIRLALDQTNLNLVNGLAFIQPLPTQNAGNAFGMQENNVAMMVNGLPTPSAQIVIGAPEATSWFSEDSQGLWQAGLAQVKFPADSSGVWYPLQQISNSAPFYGTMNSGNLVLNIAVAFDPNTGGIVSPRAAYSPTGQWTGISATQSNASCTISVGNELLAFHQPMTLPSGCVIDLYYSQIPPTWYSQQSVLPNSVPAGYMIVANDPNTAGNVIVRQYNTPMDLMFSPRGNLTGSVSALGAIFFCIRDIRDASNIQMDPTKISVQSQLAGESLILALYPQTGLVQTYDLDITDANGDGFADNIYNFAQRGMAAGR